MLYLLCAFFEAFLSALNFVLYANDGHHWWSLAAGIFIGIIFIYVILKWIFDSY